MAGVVSANVVLVALTSDILHAGARGLGYLEAGWAAGAILGGLIASQLREEMRLLLYVSAFAVLAVGHATTPFITILLAATLLQSILGFCRALGGVVAQSALMSIVPRHFMGRTQSAMAIVTLLCNLQCAWHSDGWRKKRASSSGTLCWHCYTRVLRLLPFARANCLEWRASNGGKSGVPHLKITTIGPFLKYFDNIRERTTRVARCIPA